MKKVALCLHGLSHGTNHKGVTVSPERGCKSHYKSIIENNDVDVFLHSWNPEHEREMIKMYNPVSFDFIQPKKFPKRQDIRMNEKSMHAMFSMMDGLKNVLGQVKKYAEKNKITYDYVIKSRYDLYFGFKFNPDNFQKDMLYCFPNIKRKNVIHDIFIVSQSRSGMVKTYGL